MRPAARPVDPLVEQLAKHVASDQLVTYLADWQRPKVYPPVGYDQVALAETRLGFLLPDLLREIYTKVGNGGFGPGYGLIGLNGGATDRVGTDERNLIQCYESRRFDPDWPEKLLPICTWGCAIYSCLDCSRPGVPVISYDPNGNDHPPGRQPNIFHFESLADWIERWLRGEDLWELMYSGAHLRDAATPAPTKSEDLPGLPAKDNHVARPFRAFLLRIARRRQ